MKNSAVPGIVDIPANSKAALSTFMEENLYNSKLLVWLEQENVIAKNTMASAKMACDTYQNNLGI